MHRWSWSLSIVILLGACTVAGDGAGSADAPVAAIDEETRRQLESELVTADREFARSVSRLGLGGWLAAFAPTGQLVLDGTPHLGREGVRRALLPLYADTTFSFSFDPTYAEVARSGDFGFTVGRYARSTDDTSAAVVDSGTYLTAWRRQPDGTWKVQAHIGSPRD